jgi:hypothetical protein
VSIRNSVELANPGPRLPQFAPSEPDANVAAGSAGEPAAPSRSSSLGGILSFRATAKASTDHRVSLPAECSKKPLSRHCIVSLIPKSAIHPIGRTQPECDHSQAVEPGQEASSGTPQSGRSSRSPARVLVEGSDWAAQPGPHCPALAGRAALCRGAFAPAEGHRRRRADGSHPPREV